MAHSRSHPLTEHDAELLLKQPGVMLDEELTAAFGLGIRAYSLPDGGAAILARDEAGRRYESRADVVEICRQTIELPTEGLVPVASLLVHGQAFAEVVQSWEPFIIFPDGEEYPVLAIYKEIMEYGAKGSLKALASVAIMNHGVHGEKP